MRSDDSGAANELVDVDLSSEERKVLRSGLLMWGGPATMTDEIARTLWFPSAVEFDADRDRLMSGIEEGVARTSLDWHRVVAATGLVFISWVLGARVDWYVVSGLDERVTLARI